MSNNTSNPGWDVVPDGKKKSMGGKGFEKGKSSYNADLFMKLPDGGHKIRLIGKAPHTIYVAWIPNPYKKDEKVAKGKESKIKVIVPEAYIDRLKSINIIPRENYAMLCFDRKDTVAGITRLKILEKGSTVFRAFKGWGKAHAGDDGVFLSPGDLMKGPDWYIEATVPDNILETTYQFTNLEAKPISKLEAELLKRDPTQHEDKPLGERGLIDLKKYYDTEKERGAKVLELFLKSNNSLEETQSVDDFVGAKNSKPIESLDDLPSSDDDVDEDDAEASIDEQLKDIEI